MFVTNASANRKSGTGEHRAFGYATLASGGFWSPRALMAPLLAGLVLFPVAGWMQSQLRHRTIKTGAEGALMVTHSPMGRVQSAEVIGLHVARSAGHSVTIQFDQRFMEHYDVENIGPLAKTVSSSAGGQMLAFDAPSDRDLDVTMTVRPRSWGQQSVNIGVNVFGVMTAETTLNQIVLP